MRTWIQGLHRLFNPTMNPPGADTFTLKYPDDRPSPAPGTTHVNTEPRVPGDQPLDRVRARASTLTSAVDRELNRLQGDLSADLRLNVGKMRVALRADLNQDVVFREFSLPFDPPVPACLIHIDGVVDPQQVNLSVLMPLMSLPRVSPRATGLDLLAQAEATLVPSRGVKRTFSLSALVGNVCSGDCALLVETVPGALTIDLRQWPTRAPEPPQNEQVVRGPQEGFTEALRVNTALLRRQLMVPELVIEPAKIGRRSRNDVCICYMDGVVNPELLEEVRRRLSYLNIDVVNDSGMLEQLIEDSPKGFLPTIGTTQRPDRAAAHIAEGRVVIMSDCSPYALIAPAVFGDFIRNPEDYYIKWPYGIFLRVIRVVGLMITLLLPALYIAVANFHPEMIPSSLLMAIAASREPVPFPAPIEVLFMEVAFEVIREGSLRIPQAMGQTVGIVGALILGQAAVQASIVSPLLVIVVATTGLGSFTIPDYAFSLTVRLFRFVFIALAASFGLYGVATGLFIASAHAASLRSFGIPFMTPWGPRSAVGPDGVVRGPLYKMDLRPAFLRTQDKRRQGRSISAWLTEAPNRDRG